MVRDTSISGRAVGLAIHLAVVLVVLVTLFPVLHIASVSLSSNTEVVRNNVTFYPRQFNLNAYEVIIRTPTLPNAYKNSLVYMGLGTFINVVMTVSMGYALSRKRLVFRQFFSWMIVVPFFFTGGLIPTYLIVRALGMFNTIWALLIPGAIAVWNLIITRTFFQTLPQELEDSAFMDGANDIVVLFQIMLPVAKAGIAVIALFYAVSHWNSWFPAVLYLRDARMHPLQVILRNIVIEDRLTEQIRAQVALSESLKRAAEGHAEEYVNVERLKYAVLFASILPMLVLYPFIQRYFVKGIMVGSLRA